MKIAVKIGLTLSTLLAVFVVPGFFNTSNADSIFDDAGSGFLSDLFRNIFEGLSLNFDNRATLCGTNLYSSNRGICESLETTQTILELLIPIVFGLIILFFIYNLGNFLLKTDTKDTEELKRMLWYGIIAVFVAASIWGIVALLQGVVGVDDGDRGRYFQYPEYGDR